VIGTYRFQDAPERLVATVAAWQRQGRLRHLPLTHLTTDEAEKLLTTLGMLNTPNEATSWVRQNGGNPYFLLELQRTRGDAAPNDLATLVRATLEQAQDQERRLGPGPGPLTFHVEAAPAVVSPTGVGAPRVGAQPVGAASATRRCQTAAERYRMVGS
jgi:hypothetical protein